MFVEGEKARIEAQTFPSLTSDTSNTDTPKDFQGHFDILAEI